MKVELLKTTKDSSELEGRPREEELKLLIIGLTGHYHVTDRYQHRTETVARKLSHIGVRIVKEAFFLVLLQLLVEGRVLFIRHCLQYTAGPTTEQRVALFISRVGHECTEEGVLLLIGNLDLLALVVRQKLVRRNKRCRLFFVVGLVRH